MTGNKETFMNLMTDFGFKRLFGTEKFKHILIRFLNILFKEDGIQVGDVIYHDKEVFQTSLQQACTGFQNDGVRDTPGVLKHYEASDCFP